MIYLFLSRSITWPFSWNKKTSSILDEENETNNVGDKTSSLISNKELLAQIDRTKNMDENKSLIEKDKMSPLPPVNALSALGKHYLTREDLEKMIQARFEQETPRDRVERFLWKE